jgi:hypothetical protein
MDSELVSSSVRGSLFFLPRDMLLKSDWKLAQLVTAGYPSDSTDGFLYLNADPLCFRLVVSLLLGVTNMEVDVKHLPISELFRLSKTAHYLCCFDIENTV